ncbi:uncharacterized protein JN550_001456 [Neoarthrinium moseri]|uniref:uncharacterized protein n=1 Tax=Neoarthrinium moseri TaxID=1658444 RepID=UPI001FDDA440|nr:uncharacterized protein JN550_001456 [Neoarthrinium moseri]KAI1875960.1 hypothetical protein JN550_001456 [Neoarthrinium moseri]
MDSSSSRNTAKSLANAYSYYIRGRVILVTGVSPGSLGAAFLKVIAGSGPSEIILAGRDRGRLQATAQMVTEENSSINLRLLPLDFRSLSAVRVAADRVMAWADLPHIDIMVNSAGVMATDWAISLDGFESQLAVNHLGPFLFINLIMDKILKSKAPRVILVGSDGHRFSPFRFPDYSFQDGVTYDRWQAYGQSKTASSLMALKLAEKLGSTHNLLAFSVHPGFVKTNADAHINWTEELPRILRIDQFLGNQEGWMGAVPPSSLDQGIANYVYAAFDPYLWTSNGWYLEDCRVGDPRLGTIKPWVTSSAEADRLWTLSESLVCQEFKY